jgi:hypothetical protein
MQKLDELVDLYLRMDTNYALFITGDWGIGKTYYLKNLLKKNIEQTPVFSNYEKKYRPVLISLFGLKSIEEIQLEILLSLYPILNNTKFKLGTSILKIITKGIMQIKGIGEFINIVSPSDIKPEVLINLNEIVICFDDLERISPNLRIEEFIGYVNKLVENDNVKILIIANENRITDDNFTFLKEKVIGNSIEYIPDFSLSFDSILNDKFIGSPDYKGFLEQNKDYILNLFTPNTSNLRFLIFALQYFQVIYSEICLNFTIDEKLLEKKDEILLEVLRFSLTISFLYKEGKINLRDTKDINRLIGHDFKALIADQVLKQPNEEKPKTVGDEIQEKYYINSEYHYFNSIFEYITGGGKFNYSNLISELHTAFHVQNNIFPEHYLVIESLSYQRCFNLSDSEYLSLTRKMLNYAKNGAYELSNYLMIFAFVMRFGNPLKQNSEKLEKTLIKGMRKGLPNYNYDIQLDIKLSIQVDSSYKENLLKLRTAAIDFNNQILINFEKSKAKELENLFYTDFEAFTQKVYKPNEDLFVDSLFSNFNFIKFYSFFLSSEQGLKWEIARFISNRYTSFPPKRYKTEVPFLQKLKDRLIKKKETLHGKNITGYIYSELVKNLQSSIDKLNEIPD